MPAKGTEPTCRYGHGTLVLLHLGDEKDQWIVTAEENRDVYFAFQLYVCTECGYLEAFDPDVASTLRELKRIARKK